MEEGGGFEKRTGRSEVYCKSTEATERATCLLHSQKSPKDLLIGDDEASTPDGERNAEETAEECDRIFFSLFRDKLKPDVSRENIEAVLRLRKKQKSKKQKRRRRRRRKTTTTH